MPNEPIVPVRFLVDVPEAEFGSVFAYFPRTDFNKELYGHSQKVCYARVGQHGKCEQAYARQCREATPEEYEALKGELENDVGYRLKVLNSSTNGKEPRMRK
ncbi:MAG: hypothetical protein M1378_00185 [Bacteroidetes bacterium]|nr:hypothetical protein [Bacteroidota bacterium]